MQLIFTQSEPQKISDLPANTVFEFDGSTYIKIDDTLGILNTSANPSLFGSFPAIKVEANGFDLAAFPLSDTEVKVLGSVKVKL